MAKNMPENQNGEEEVKEVRISREELKQARREAKAAKKAASEKEKLQKTDSDNKNQKVKAKTDANAKPKLGKRISKAFKEMISELKKGYVAERKSGIAINAYRLRRRACLFGNFDCYGLRSWQIA